MIRVSEGYAYPIGPMPQVIANDLRSLDEMVRDLVEECQCASQFSMIRVSEGKYRIGDTKILIFVRILRSHVMVRVGGGWDTLQNYLDKHDPCRCRRGHRSTIGATMSVRSNKSPMAVGVTYDRSESPGTPRRRSSAFQGNGSRQSSFVDKPRGYSRQWDSPRGSLAGITSSGYGQASPAYSSPRGSLTGASGTLPRSRSPSAPHTSFRTPSHSPATNSRSFELGPSRDGSKLFNGRNGPSPLLKDGAQPQSPYDTLPVGRNTLTQKVHNLLEKNSVAFSRLNKTW